MRGLRWILGTLGLLLLGACGNARRPVVEVTSDGRVLYDGEPTTINGLIRSAREAKRPITLRAGDDAIWMHVQWVLAALHEAGVTSVRNGGARSTQDLRLSSGYVRDKFDFPGYGGDGDEERTAGLTVQVNRTEAGAVTYFPEHGSTVTGSRAPAAIRKLTKTWQKKGRDDNVRISWAVEASGRVPYKAVMVAFEALDSAGAERIQLGVEALHPWDRDLSRLPAPPHDELIFRWRDWTFRECYPVNPPLASMSVGLTVALEDDRLMFTLTADGRILWNGEPQSLHEFAAQLETQAKLYERKRRRTGRPAFRTFPVGGRWSRLYALLNADKEAPWGHVQWVMAELAAARYYKLQFGTRKFPGPELGSREAERAWAGRDIHPCVALEARLAAFLPTEGPRHLGAYLDVQLLEDPKRYRYGAKESNQVTVLAKWIRRSHDRWQGDDRLVGTIEAPPETPFQEVVTVINAFHQADVEVIDFFARTRAPKAVRDLKRLPPP